MSDAAATANGAGPLGPVTSARRTAPSPSRVLAIASLGAAVAFVDATIVNIAFPSIEKSFSGVSISSLSWVLNAYNIVFAAFLVAAGRIADLLGRRRIFVFGLELFTAASVLCAVAPSAGALVAFRIVQALGAAFLVPASLALVLNAFPPERRAHGVALLSAVAAAAAGLGPSLGGILVSVANWRLVFLVNLPIGVVAVVLARRQLIESRAPGRRRMPDMVGALLFALAIASLVLGVVKGSEWGWGSPRVLGAFAAALVLGAVFVWRCSWHRSPIIDLGLLRGRTFSAANAHDDHRRVRLLRLHARQRPLPHRRLALQRPAGRSRAHPRPVRGRGRGGADEPHRTADRPATGARRGRADLGRSGHVAGGARRRTARLPRRVAAGDRAAGDRRRHAVPEHVAAPPSRRLRARASRRPPA